MQEKNSTLERECTDLLKLNQEQAAAFMHQNKELELLNRTLRMEVETLKRSSASLEEQVRTFLYAAARINSIYMMVLILRRYRVLRTYWQVRTYDVGI
jgi:cell division protein FtsB